MEYTSDMVKVILNVTKSWRLQVFNAETLELIKMYFPFEITMLFEQPLTEDQEELVHWWATGPKAWGR